MVENKDISPIEKRNANTTIHIGLGSKQYINLYETLRHNVHIKIDRELSSFREKEKKINDSIKILKSDIADWNNQRT